MKPVNKNKKTKCCVSLSQGVQEENGLRKGKECQGKKMKNYHNGLLMKTMKVLRCRKCICNCHRGGKCGCKGNEMKFKNNNSNKEFIEKASNCSYSYNSSCCCIFWIIYFICFINPSFNCFNLTPIPSVSCTPS